MGWRCRDHVHLLSHDPHQLVRDWDDDDDGCGVDGDDDTDVDDDDGSHDVVANGVHDHLHSYDSPGWQNLTAFRRGQKWP